MPVSLFLFSLLYIAVSADDGVASCMTTIIVRQKVHFLLFIASISTTYKLRICLSWAHYIKVECVRIPVAIHFVFLKVTVRLPVQASLLPPTPHSQCLDALLPPFLSGDATSFGWLFCQPCRATKQVGGPFLNNPGSLTCSVFFFIWKVIKWDCKLASWKIFSCYQ